jgi:hypothetical protein
MPATNALPDAHQALALAGVPDVELGTVVIKQVNNEFFPRSVLVDVVGDQQKPQEVSLLSTDPHFVGDLPGYDQFHVRVDLNKIENVGVQATARLHDQRGDLSESARLDVAPQTVQLSGSNQSRNITFAASPIRPPRPSTDQRVGVAAGPVAAQRADVRRKAVRPPSRAITPTKRR